MISSRIKYLNIFLVLLKYSLKNSSFSSQKMNIILQFLFPSMDPKKISELLILARLTEYKLMVEWLIEASLCNKVGTVEQCRKRFVDLYHSCYNNYNIIYHSNGRDTDEFDNFAESIASLVAEIFKTIDNDKIDCIKIWTTIYHIIISSELTYSMGVMVDIKDIIIHAKVAIIKFCTGVCIDNGISVDIVQEVIDMVDNFIKTIPANSIRKRCGFLPTYANEIIVNAMIFAMNDAMKVAMKVAMKDAMKDAMENPHIEHTSASTSVSTSTSTSTSASASASTSASASASASDEVDVDPRFPKAQFDVYFDKHAPFIIESICDNLDTIPAYIVRAALYSAHHNNFAHNWVIYRLLELV